MRHDPKWSGQVGIGRPMVPSEEIGVEELTGTAKSLALAAAKAGYRVVAVDSLMDDGGRAVSIGGRMLDWGFSARYSPQGSWEVRIRRPGWPEASGNVVALRAMFASQTPRDIGKVR